MVQNIAEKFNPVNMAQQRHRWHRINNRQTDLRWRTSPKSMVESGEEGCWGEGYRVPRPHLPKLGSVGQRYNLNRSFGGILLLRKPVQTVRSPTSDQQEKIGSVKKWRIKNKILCRIHPPSKIYTQIPRKAGDSLLRSHIGFEIYRKYC